MVRTSKALQAYYQERYARSLVEELDFSEGGLKMDDKKEKLKSYMKELSMLPVRRQRIQDDYEKRVAETDKREKELKDKIMELEKEN